MPDEDDGASVRDGDVSIVVTVGFEPERVLECAVKPLVEIIGEDYLARPT